MYVAVVDIGKPGKNLGWAIDGPTTSDGTDLDKCVEHLAAALRDGPLALGFEAPMFVPVRDDPATLTKARNGESGKGIPSRPFSAGPGPTVLVTGLVVVPYILKHLRDEVPEATATFDPCAPLSNKRVLFFEAFVTNQQKTTDARHVEDAKLAIKEFRKEMQSPKSFKSAVFETQSFNLLGAMLLYAGWTTDLKFLSDPVWVVKPRGCD